MKNAKDRMKEGGRNYHLLKSGYEKLIGSGKWREEKIQLAGELDAYNIIDNESGNIVAIYLPFTEAIAVHKEIKKSGKIISWLKENGWQKFSDGGYMKKGGIVNQYAGKDQQMIWIEWTPSQRYHFLEDHADKIVPLGLSSNDTGRDLALRELSEKGYTSLPLRVKEELKTHISEGQYKDGGGVPSIWNKKFTFKELFTKF